MSDRSQIQWTDATWNPSTGCTKVSPGCANCYIVRTPAFRINGRKFINGSTDLQLHENRLDQPLRWKKPRRIFVNSLSDLFHEDVPSDFIARTFGVMALAGRHTFQVLTKRAGTMRRLLNDPYFREEVDVAIYEIGGDNDARTFPWPLPNVWLGVSVENQPMYDKRIGDLLRTPAAIRFLSVEPMLGPVDLRMGGMSMPDYSAHDPLPQVDWVIVGGESGPGARGCDIGNMRSVVHQCQAASVAVFVKQLGGNPTFGDKPIAYYDGYPLKDRKGGDITEWPEDLRVREFPR